jgi:Tfp pilus assembly protein PilO
MMERLNGRVSLLLSAAGLLLVLLVGWFAVVSPQRSKAEELSVKIDAAETRLQIAQDLVRGPALQQSKAELATLKTAIPDEVRMSGILRQLSRASANSRVRILGITPAPAVAAGAADVVAITVAVEGRYFGIREFLRLLRAAADVEDDKVKASGRLFGVDSIQFTGGDTTGSMVQATLSVTAFSFRGAATAPGTAAGTLSAPLDSTVAEAATP